MRNGNCLFKVLFVFILCFALASCTKSKAEGIVESKRLNVSNTAAPEACFQVLREFLAYIFRPAPDIFHDDAAQFKFLSLSLRKGVVFRWNTYQEYIKSSETPDIPDNGTFVGAWAYPSHYTVVGDRRYDNQAVIDVLYEWKNPEANYAGDKRLLSFVFVFEDKAWKLEDIYTFKGKFVKSSSLSEDLQQNIYK